MGVRAIKLKADDSVVAMTKVNEDTVVLTVTETGYGRKSSIADYRLQNRGGKGITNYRVEKYGDVAAVLNVTDEDDVIMIASDGVIIRVPAAQISTFNRPSKGVRVKKVTGDTIILSAAISEHDDEEEFTVPEAPDADAAEAITEAENEGENETEEKAEE
jgi:DNA gyrase subunit A